MEAAKRRPLESGPRYGQRQSLAEILVPDLAVRASNRSAPSRSEGWDTPQDGRQDARPYLTPPSAPLDDIQIPLAHGHVNYRGHVRPSSSRACAIKAGKRR